MSKARSNASTSFALARSFDPNAMQIVRSGKGKEDLLGRRPLAAMLRNYCDGEVAEKKGAPTQGRGGALTRWTGLYTTLAAPRFGSAAGRD